MERGRSVASSGPAVVDLSTPAVPPRERPRARHQGTPPLVQGGSQRLLSCQQLKARVAPTARHSRQAEHPARLRRSRNRAFARSALERGTARWTVMRNGLITGRASNGVALAHLCHPGRRLSRVGGRTTISSCVREPIESDSRPAAPSLLFESNPGQVLMTSGDAFVRMRARPASSAS